jgi:hypothetical protein
VGAVADQRNAGRGGVELQNRLVQAVRPAQQIDRRTSRPTATSRGDEDQEESEGIDLTRGEERLTSTVDGRRGEEEKKGRRVFLYAVTLRPRALRSADGGSAAPPGREMGGNGDENTGN